MISFESLIKAFHEATLAANDALVQKNANVITEFFDECDGSSRLKEKLQKLGTELNPNETLDLEKLNLSINDLKEYLEDDNVTLDPTCKLKPKMVTIQYPNQTENGSVIHDVHVPLISLVPVNQTGIEEVNIKTELELALKNDELMVSFPKRRRNHLLEEDHTSCISEIDIKLTPTTETEGLRKIIEGYDKILRAQIPG